MTREKYCLKSDVEINAESIDLYTIYRVKNLQIIKQNIARRGNNLKTSWLHQIIHIVYNITQHSCHMDSDISRGKRCGKLNIKDNTKLSNNEKEILNCDNSCRIL